MEDIILTVAFINIRGQSGLTIQKQLQIESFIRYNKCDIINLQEINIDDESFSSCDFINSSYNIISNNSVNKYGTASLVKAELSVENIRNDSEGRVQVYDVGDLTFSNIYLHSGTDGKSRNGRDKLCSEILPNMLINCKESGAHGGDFNCIIKKADATHNPESKMSRCLERLVAVNDWKDSFRDLHPKTQEYSRYYSNSRAEGASRIDRCYHHGELKVKSAKYIPLAFSDHFAHLVQFILPNKMARILSPKTRPSFRLKAEVISDSVFKERLGKAMISWQRVREFQDKESKKLGVLFWWEKLVKPGIRKIAIQRSKEMNIARKEELNLLMLRQLFLTRKLQNGQVHRLGELQAVHLLIEEWYRMECKKVQHQARVEEFQSSEKSSIYHHELHKRTIKKTSILKLQTELGMIEGHADCAAYLEQSVKNLLLHPADLDTHAQNILLDEVTPVFTEKDIQMLLTPPTREDVWNTICSSNLTAAPGTDGIPSLAYKECWSILGDALVEVMLAIFNCQELPHSMRTALMVFGCKPKKPNSLQPKDKRRISLLNCDFKIASGLEARSLKKTATHSLSHLQLVAGNNRRIHHGINFARNAIYSAGKAGHSGCGILDMDLIAAFDWLCLDWVYKVLHKKGMPRQVLGRLQNLYRENIAIVVVNNMHGAAVRNDRLSLKQGDLPSMILFSYGIDPLLDYLEKRLQGILISSLPSHGPVQLGAAPIPPLEERYKLIGYADDVKPAITSMQEFSIVDRAMGLFEGASGCKLHRDPASQKCKFLPLARWRGTLEQTDIPCRYMTISDHLEMLGVELRATWGQTKKANGDIVQSRVATTCRQWKSGKFMELTRRSWSLNQYCLSKIWFRTHSVDLRVMDLNSITSSVKSWLYADQMFKPEEMIIFRPPSYGGLGVHSVKWKAMAGLIRSFLETACNEKFQTSLFHSQLYRYHILDDRTIPNPGFPPFYNAEFFKIIKKVHEDSPLNVAHMSEKQWYAVLIEDNVTMESTNGEQRQYIPSRIELKNPETNWEHSWRLARLKGLGSENVSFLFRLLHCTLPTQERLSKTNANHSPLCKFPGCTGSDEEDTLHALVTCSGNNGTGYAIMNGVKRLLPGLKEDEALRLDLDIEEHLELPVVFTLSVAWGALWDLRLNRTRPELYLIRAQLEAKVAILRNCRNFFNSAQFIDMIIDTL